MAITVVPYCHIYSDGGTKAFWQSAWEGQTLHGATFMPFAVGALTNTSTGDLSDLTITLPELEDVVELYHASVALSWLWEVRLYVYTPTESAVYPTTGGADRVTDWPSSGSSWGGMTLRGAFLGEVVSGSLQDHELTVTLGNRISKLSVPPLRYTTSLVGNPAEF